jgi:hypothetical protein
MEQKHKKEGAEHPWSVAILETLQKIEETPKDQFLPEFLADLQKTVTRWQTTIDAFKDLSKNINAIQ